MQYNFRGNYDAAQNYAIKDVVSYTQSNITKYFMCLNPIANTNPQTPNLSSDTNSWGLINALSNFPQSVDAFIYRVNISGNDKVAIARINELTLKTTLTTDEQDELSYLIAQNRNKLFLADDLNAIQDSLSNLQIFFKDKVESYINTSLTAIQTARDNALNSLEAKKASLDLYLDSTTAGALRVDIGLMGDLTTTNKHSLVEALNETRASAQSYKLTDDSGKALPLAINIDLNTIMSTGFHFVIGTGTNAPINPASGILEVFDYSTGTSRRVMQRFTRSTTAEIWERLYTGTTWTGWTKVATNIDAQMMKITTDSGGTKITLNDTTGDILQEIKNLGQGMHTFYAIAGSKNLPANGTSGSIRGTVHLTTANYGWVYASDYKNNIYTNYLDNGTWKGWHKLVADSDVQETLWVGVKFLGVESTGDPQKVVPTKKLSECRNGWILVWSDYDAAIKHENNFDFNYSYIPKFIITKHSDTLSNFPISSYVSSDKVIITAKKVGIYDAYLLGHPDNKERVNEANDVVLRYVLEW